MKKLIVILFIICNIGLITFAKEEIYLEGAFDSYDYYDYRFIGGDINPLAEGEYFLDYYSNDLGFVKRKINVISKNTLKNGYHCLIKDNDLELDDEMKFYFKGECKFSKFKVLYGEVFINDDFEQHVINSNNAFYMVTYDNVVSSFVIYDKYSYSVSLNCINDKLLWLIGYEDYDHVNLSLIEIEVDGGSKEVYKIDTRYDDYPRDMIIIDDYIYVFVDSGVYGKDYLVNQCCVIKLDSFYNEVGHLNFGGSSYNKTYGAIYANCSIYVYCNTIGFGSLSTDKEKIVEIDKNLQIRKYKKVSGGSGENKIGLTDEGIIISYSSFNHINICEYDYSLFLTSQYSYSIDPSLTVDNIIVENDDVYFNAKTMNYSYYYGKISNSTLIENTNKTLRLNYISSDEVKLLHFIQNEFLIDMASFVIKYDNNAYYINSEKITFHDLENSYLKDKLFGDNYALSKYENDYLVFFIKNDFYIPLDKNIIDFGVYPIGFELDSNTVFKVDGKEYKSSYKFREAGLYEIEFIGQSDHVIYNITIKEIYPQTSSIEYRDLSVEMLDSLESYQDNKKNVYYYLEEEKENDSFSLSIIIICISFFGLTSMVVPIKEKRND